MCAMVCVINVDYVLKNLPAEIHQAPYLLLVCFIVVLFHYHVFIFGNLLLNYVFLLPWLILDSIFFLYAIVVFVVVDVAF